MAKKKQSMSTQKRDWVIIGLILAIVATNWVWFETYKAQDITNKNVTSAWLVHQVQINKLKACVDQGTQPCDITPTQQ